MDMFARFDENPAIILQDIKKKKKRYGRTDVKTVYPPQTKFAGGITKILITNSSLIKVKRIAAFCDTFDLHKAIIGLLFSVSS